MSQNKNTHIRVLNAGSVSNKNVYLIKVGRKSSACSRPVSNKSDCAISREVSWVLKLSKTLVRNTLTSKEIKMFKFVIFFAVVSVACAATFRGYLPKKPEELGKSKMFYFYFADYCWLFSVGCVCVMVTTKFCGDFVHILRCVSSFTSRCESGVFKFICKYGTRLLLNTVEITITSDANNTCCVLLW